MSRPLELVRVYLSLVGASLRSQMQYRTAFAIRTFADFLVIIPDFATIWLLSRHFGLLRGWSFAELALLYGMVALSWGLVEAGMYGLENFSTYLLRGDVDRWLLRPRGVLFQVSASEFAARKLGRILQGLIVLALASLYLELEPTGLAWVALGVAGGIPFFIGIVAAGAASQFWTLGHTSELQNALTYGGSAALSYPISVYANWFRRLFTYAIPLAFVNYFPAIAALGRTEAAGWPRWMPLLSPFACLATMAAGMWLFSIGLRRYESTGT